MHHTNKYLRSTLFRLRNEGFLHPPASVYAVLLTTLLTKGLTHDEIKTQAVWNTSTLFAADCSLNLNFITPSKMDQQALRVRPFGLKNTIEDFDADQSTRLIRPFELVSEYSLLEQRLMQWQQRKN